MGMQSHPQAGKLAIIRVNNKHLGKLKQLHSHFEYTRIVWVVPTAYVTARLYFRDAALTTTLAPQGQVLPNHKSRNNVVLSAPAWFKRCEIC